MLDGIKLNYPIKNFAAWQQAVPVEFFTSVNKDTGAIKEKAVNDRQTTIVHVGRFEHYNLMVKEVHKNNLNGRPSSTHYLTIDGSLHKNHFNGKNFEPFTWQFLQQEINHLEQVLQLTAELSKIDNLEIGVNIPVSFPVFDFLQNSLIAYKGHSFNRYNPDKNGVCLGYRCNSLTQYEVKVYDKGLQNDLPYPLMRFELRFTRMQKLNAIGIKNLTDIKDRQKVNECLPLLLEAWDNVLLSDHSISIDNPKLKQDERELLINGSNPRYWEGLKKQAVRMYNYQRAKFRNLVQQYGSNNHSNIRKLIDKEWHELMNTTTAIPGAVLIMELSEFTIKIKGKNVQNRYCLSCGKDISHQDPKSKYCSAKYIGYEAAHKCRNAYSNPRNNFKRKIDTINRRGVLFDIIPYVIKKVIEFN